MNKNIDINTLVSKLLTGEISEEEGKELLSRVECNGRDGERPCVRGGVGEAVSGSIVEPLRGFLPSAFAGKNDA